MIDKRIPCARDCPERSATCKCSCEKYKEYRKAKEEEYKKRAHVCEGYPESIRKRGRCSAKCAEVSRVIKRHDRILKGESI